MQQSRIRVKSAFSRKELDAAREQNNSTIQFSKRPMDNTSSIVYGNRCRTNSKNQRHLRNRDIFSPNNHSSAIHNCTTLKQSNSWIQKTEVSKSVIVQKQKPVKYFKSGQQPQSIDCFLNKSTSQTIETQHSKINSENSQIFPHSSQYRLQTNSNLVTPDFSKKTPFQKHMKAFKQLIFDDGQQTEGKRNQENSSIALLSSRSVLREGKDSKLQDFVKGKFLGKGKFGQVFAVKHKLTGFVCALKVISKKVVREEKMQVQLAKQIRIHVSLNHPNICSLYGFFSDTDNIYLLIELCSDGMVYNLLKKHRRLPEQSVAYLIKQICLGTNYLHRRKIVHRDLKPENVILQNGIAKICDFGWAAYCQSSRKTMCGTPLYYSPQMVKGNNYDQKVDVWAIGILTYELLVGKIPFKIYCEQQLSKIITDGFEFPDWIDITETAKDFINKILQKDQRERTTVPKLLSHPFLDQVNDQKYIQL